MHISSSPRKVVPLNSGDDGLSHRSIPTITKRAFFCGVVVEGPNDGADLSEDVQDLVASLGDKVPSDKDYDPAPATPASLAQAEGHTRPRALTNTSALADLINELVITERSYVKRLRVLKDSYADPLRAYARSKDTAILPTYEANILFGNIDHLLPANEAFLTDLEQMMSPNGAETVGRVGDVALRHFKELQAFECYKQYYMKREEAQRIFMREMAKKSSTGFSAFVERIKYSANDAKVPVGLRELLMEPVQRIPRYTLLFRSMIRLMGASDPQRAKLIEADDIASRIALAEADSHTRLAAILNCLATSIEGFPPALISSSRRFVDCIDMVDNLSDAAGLNPFGSLSSTPSRTSTPMGSSVSGTALNCTLFLFDDKLMIVKRPGSDKSGRSLAGLDEIARLASGGLVSGKTKTATSMRRNGMSCRGVVDITDVNATDVSGSEMHLYLESPPVDQSDRWAGRPFRVLSTVLPGAPYVDPSRVEQEKLRFLKNLWHVQARYRTRHGQSVALCADEQEVESRAGKVTVAQTFFNVYQRTMFLKEAKKTKVVLHIDSLGNADPLPFGMNGPPYVVVRVRPMPGELCRYSVHSCDPDEEPREDVVQSSQVPSQVIQTIHQYGLFKFKTDNPSRPATPSGGNRSRAHIFALDVISRNLFGTSKNKDSASDSMGRHLRSKTALSRTSTLGTESSGTITTADSFTHHSHRTYSTAATSVSSFAIDDSSLGKRSSKSKKLIKTNRSATTAAGESDYVSEDEPSNKSLSRRRARSLSVPRHEDSIEYSDHGDEDVDTTMLDDRERGDVTVSEMDLSMRLKLARHNSQNQHGKSPSRDRIEAPVEGVIYEEDPPAPITRATSRGSRLSRSEKSNEQDALSFHSTSPHHTARSITPTPASRIESSRKERKESFHSTRDRRPTGPRPPSPLMPTSPTINAMQVEIEGALESTLARMSPEQPSTPEGLCLSGKDSEEPNVFSPTPVHETPSRLPRITRPSFAPLESTPKRKLGKFSEGTPGIGPLQIKKKGPTGPTTPAPVLRKPVVTNSPLSSPDLRAETIRGTGPSTRQRSDSRVSVSATDSSSEELVFAEKLVQLAKRTRDDFDSSQRALKRIKLEVNMLPNRIMQDSPRAVESLPTPSRGLNPAFSKTSAVTREAQARMDEMRALIEQRHGVTTTPRAPRPKSFVEGSLSSPQSSNNAEFDATQVQSWVKSISDLSSSAESDLGRAANTFSRVEDGVGRLVAIFKDNVKNMDKASSTVKTAQHQYEQLQKELSIVTAENELLYEAFNGELEDLFKKVTLPNDEAWVAMSADLHETKKDRFRLKKENSDLKRRLRDIELERDELAALLRHHGLIP